MAEEIMKKRMVEFKEAYEAQWDGGAGSHHPDYDPTAVGEDVVKASRETEELLNAILVNDVKLVYKKIEEDLDARNPNDWTPLSYAKAAGKYGLAYEKGIYPEDVLRYYGATEYGSAPLAQGARSPRESYNPEAENFARDRGSYQNPPEHP
eukprot:jgi/Pico_ML_1/54960/g92.t1